jgi:pilus assembly protein CpaB
MFAALLVYSELQQREAAIQRATAQTVKVLVAARTLPLGAKIDSSSVRLALWSRDAIPPGSYSDSGAVLGAFVRNSFVENEPILGSKLFMGRKSAGVMPLLIPPGMRAMSVPVDKVSDVAGFVQPQTRVDVVVAISNPGNGGNDKPFSKTILENVEVIAVNQEIEGDKDKAEVVEVVTLLVSPEEAERLALASREGGNLRLAIRNYDDAKLVLTKGADIADLTRMYTPIEPPPLRAQNVVSHAPIKPRETVNVEVYRNGKSNETVSFIHASNEPTDSQQIKPLKISAVMPNEVSNGTKPADKASLPARYPTAVTDKADSAEALVDAGSDAALTSKPKAIEIP